MSEHEYTLDLTPYEVTQGKEKLVEAPDGSTYAGAWMRDLFNEADEDEVILGYFDDPVRGSDEPARFPIEALYRHVALFGVTGYGKSTFIQNHLLQLAERDAGFCFFDPKGSDSKDLIKRLPDDRMDDVVWVDPTADEYVGFNILNTYRDPDDKGYERETEEIVSNVLALLKGGSTGWGATMESIARAVALQLVRADEEYTLLDMYKILADEEEREKFADKFGDDIESVYLERLANYSDEEFDPLLRRFQAWTDNVLTRRMISTPGGLSPGTLVAESKIVIVDLSRVPAQAVSALAATGLVRGLWAARCSYAGGLDSPFFLALDEFDHLVTSEMGIDDILSMGRSLRMGAILSTQQVEQLPDEVQEAVLGNADNLFTFNPGPANMSEAGKLAQAYDIGANRLTSLPQWSFIARLITRDKQKTEPFTIQTIAPLPPLRSDADIEGFLTDLLDEHGHSASGDTEDFTEYGV